MGRPKRGILHFQNPTELSPLENIPYIPNLRRVFHPVMACVIVSYLEIHYPAPNDGTGRLVSLPVTIDMDTMSRDLQVPRRTLALNLQAVSTLYPSEAKRWMSARGAREFIRTRHKLTPRIAIYSVVADPTILRARQIIVRRNIPQLRQTFDTCQSKALSTIGTFASQPSPGIQPDVHANDSPEQTVARTTLSGVPFNGLENILLRASTIAQDRRSQRYPRLRKAVESGLEGAEVLKIKRNKAVDPEMPESMKERFEGYRGGPKGDAEDE